MKYSPVANNRTTRNIVRMAQQRIKFKTGIGVSIMLRSSQDPLNTPEKMLQKIALSLNMSYECFTKRSRERDIAELRFLGAYFLRVHFPAITLHQIAALFGGMDHSTVISGLVRANNLIYTADTRFMVKYQTALNAVNQWLNKPELGRLSAASA